MKARFVLIIVVLLSVSVFFVSCTSDSTTETDELYEFQGIDRDVDRPGSQGDGS